MRAMELQTHFGTPNLRMVDRPLPEPQAGEVLLKMRAWSLNYRDWMIVQGQYHPKLTFPLVPLSDGVGEIVAVGPGVTQRQIGERVASLILPEWQHGSIPASAGRTALGCITPGVLAEYVVLSETGVIPVPEHLSDAEAATLPCAALTAWNALCHANPIQPGETVLIQGTGGVSLFALQFALLRGAKVIATSSQDAKLERLQSLGVSTGINYRTNPDWEDVALELTNGVGVDHIVEVGGAGTLARSFKATRAGGVISLIGVLAGAQAEINPVPILMKHLRVQGIFCGSREMFTAMNAAYSKAQLRPVVDHIASWHRFPQVLEDFALGKHFGKVCLTVE